ncbi:hypothetical protein EPO34_01315 [Patescibacteria group bacterium]|nr:MAG: hypothetical protein EPO34_01315 [Patescibacteria group bacterium]
MALEPEKKGLAPVGGEIRVEPASAEATAGRRVEAAPEGKEEFEELEEPTTEQAATEPVAAPTPVQMVQRVIQAPKDRMTAEVEAVLSEGLEEIYKQLSPKERAHFKKQGEETARSVRELLMQTKVNVKKVFDAIRDWLKLLSDRANRFYLEQEAKIKTDKLLLLAEAEKRERGNAV